MVLLMTDSERSGRHPPVGVMRVIFDHQRWLSSNGRFGRRMVREGLDFNDCDLAGVDFSGADLTFTNFNRGSLNGARFVGATLQNSEFRNCDVEGTDFSGADLFGALFVTNHTAAVFEGANLEKVAWNLEEQRAMYADNRRPVEGASKPPRKAGTRPRKPEPR